MWETSAFFLRRGLHAPRRALHTQVSGWKSLIERQRRVFVLNRPLWTRGVTRTCQPQLGAEGHRGGVQRTLA